MKKDHHMEPYHPGGDPTVTDFLQVPNSATNAPGLEKQINTLRSYTNDLDNTSRWCGWLSHISVNVFVFGLIYIAITPAWQFLPLLILPIIGLFIAAKNYYGKMLPAMEYDRDMYNTMSHKDYKTVSRLTGREYHANKHGWRDHY